MGRLVSTHSTMRGRGTLESALEDLVTWSQQIHARAANALNDLVGATMTMIYQEPRTKNQDGIVVDDLTAEGS